MQSSNQAQSILLQTLSNYPNIKTFFPVNSNREPDFEKFNIDRATAENNLRDKRPGDFIIRAGSNKDLIVISQKDLHDVKHYAYYYKDADLKEMETQIRKLLLYANIPDAQKNIISFDEFTQSVDQQKAQLETANAGSYGIVAGKFDTLDKVMLVYKDIDNTIKENIYELGYSNQTEALKQKIQVLSQLKERNKQFEKEEGRQFLYHQINDVNKKSYTRNLLPAYALFAHGLDMSAMEAKEFLSGALNVPGTFILTKSPSNPGQFILHYNDGEKIPRSHEYYLADQSAIVALREALSELKALTTYHLFKDNLPDYNISFETFMIGGQAAHDSFGKNPTPGTSTIRISTSDPNLVSYHRIDRQKGYETLRFDMTDPASVAQLRLIMSHDAALRAKPAMKRPLPEIPTTPVNKNVNVAQVKAAVNLRNEATQPAPAQPVREPTQATKEKNQVKKSSKVSNFINSLFNSSKRRVPGSPPQLPTVNHPSNKSPKK